MGEANTNALRIDFDRRPMLQFRGSTITGHLTAMAMSLPTVRGGIAISGFYDLEPIRLSYVNDKLGLNEAEARRNSPMLNFPASSGPLIVTYGTAELP